MCREWGTDTERRAPLLLYVSQNESFSMRAETHCPADRECTAMKGHSTLCYNHSTRRQPEVEAVSAESPDPAPLVISCARKVCSSLSCTTRSWLPGHPYSQGALLTPGCDRDDFGVSIIHGSSITASWGREKPWLVGRQLRQLWSFCIWE